MKRWMDMDGFSWTAPPSPPSVFALRTLAWPPQDSHLLRTVPWEVLGGLSGEGQGAQGKALTMGWVVAAIAAVLPSLLLGGQLQEETAIVPQLLSPTRTGDRRCQVPALRPGVCCLSPMYLSQVKLAVHSR